MWPESGWIRIPSKLKSNAFSKRKRGKESGGPSCSMRLWDQKRDKAGSMGHWPLNLPRQYHLLKGYMCTQYTQLPEGQLRRNIAVCSLSRVAEVAWEHGWHPPKSLDSDKNFKPEHTLFCCELRFVAIYALCGDLWAKKVPFWVKTSISWVRSALLHGIYIAYFTE